MAGVSDIQKTGKTGGASADPDFTLLPQALDRTPSFSYTPPPARSAGNRLRGRLASFWYFITDCVEEESAYGHLFYWTPVFLGIGAVFWFAAPQTPSLIYLAVAASLFLGGATLVGAPRPVARFVFGTLALLFAGGLFAAWETSRSVAVVLDSSVTTTITGVVTERDIDANGRWRYTIDVTHTEKPVLRRTPSVAKLTALGRQTPFALGEKISGRARLSPPSGPALVGLNDFAFNAYFDGTGAIGFFYGKPASLGMGTPIDASVFEGAIQQLHALRGGISEHIRSVLPGDTGAFAASMVTDDRRAMSKETAEALRLAGLAHIIAISGLNMALAAGIFFVGIRSLLSLNHEITHHYPVKKIAAGGALITVTGYFLISGFAVSAERAYIMMAIMLVAVFFGRPSISLRNVALSALIILIMSPSAVMGPGFQMSYAATLALVAGYAAWQRRENRDPPFAGIPVVKPIMPVWHFVAGVFMTSLIGGFSTALFSVEHFHRIAAWGLPANLLAMPIISFIVMPAGVLALLLMPLGLDWLPLQVMGFGLDLVIAIAKWAASLDGDVVIGRIPAWLFIGLTAGFIILAIMRSRLRYAGAGLAGCLALVYLAMPGAPKPDLVIFEDGTLAALIDDDTIASTRTKPSTFIFEQWQRALRADIHLKPVIKDGAKAPKRDTERRRMTWQELAAAKKQIIADFDDGPFEIFTCRDRLWCVATAKSGAKIILATNGALTGLACELADIVITPARLKWDQCRSGARLFTAETLRRTGSVEIWFSPAYSTEIRVKSAFNNYDRPWYHHRLYDWRTGQYARAGAPP